MNTIGHSQFINTPIISILEDTERACQSLGNGIEIQPMAEYVMQTTFLRMTGASEQKLKCINWEIASFDYDYRYKLLNNPSGECSSYADKTNIYGNIRDLLASHGVECGLTETEKDMVIHMAGNEFSAWLDSSTIARWFEKEYLQYKSLRTEFQRSDFGLPAKKQLLKDNLQEYYKNVVYRQRNRYAHNLTSYQINVPTLTQLAQSNDYDRNRFRMLSLLILLDGIFITLYRKFESHRFEHAY